MFSKVVVLINKRVLCFRKYESNEFKKNKIRGWIYNL